MVRVFALLLSMVTFLMACGGKPAAPDAVYETRARVVEVHGTGDDLRVTMKHEAIPDFKDRSGTPSEMPAMAMAFGVAEGVDAGAFKPGSQWQLTFDVSWQREPVVRITSATPLAADVRLELPSN